MKKEVKGGGDSTEGRKDGGKRSKEGGSKEGQMRGPI